MDGEFTPQWRPEPEPGNALERLLIKASHDPACHGALMRKLWESEITTLIPYHPEMMGSHELAPGQELQLMVVAYKSGPFIPAYTSEIAAEYCLNIKKADDKPLGVLSIIGEAFFQMVMGLGQRVIINDGMQHGLELQPEALEKLVRGDFRHHRPSTGQGESYTLYAVNEDSIPGEMKDAVRRFCDQNPIPIAVYFFLSADPATGEPSRNDVRIIMRLRSADNHFYNDFSLMVGRLASAGVTLSTAVVTQDDTEALDFLQRCKPLWPVLEL